MCVQAVNNNSDISLDILYLIFYQDFPADEYEAAKCRPREYKNCSKQFYFCFEYI